MVGGISPSCPLYGWALWQCPDQKYGSPASWGLPPAIHPKEVHSTWITPSCLAALGRKEYLGPIDPRITRDYQEVQRAEMVVLAIVLHRCAIHTRASPDVFCGAVQELHDCLVPIVEKGNLFNMEKEKILHFSLLNIPI